MLPEKETVSGPAGVGGCVVRGGVGPVVVVGGSVVRRSVEV